MAPEPIFFRKMGTCEHFPVFTLMCVNSPVNKMLFLRKSPKSFPSITRVKNKIGSNSIFRSYQSASNIIHQIDEEQILSNSDHLSVTEYLRAYLSSNRWEVFLIQESLIFLLLIHRDEMNFMRIK